MFLFLVMVTEAIWLLLQCDKLWHGWLVAKNFDDWGAQNKTGSASVDQMRSEKSETRLTV
ncbi:hypothetical protein CPH39_17430 [Escherichia coli]|uniref:Uncharacterized protein n=6 Tax=Enterobacteriaceae TaxID=543 RepID=A0A8S7CGH2_ECOLX|nr:hypothetical protein [Escherichia coli]EFA4031167.1 hypothetical protein [Escherichia coli O108:H9]EFB2190773.1 hypothetical protein [Escherichia coli]EFC6681577.1 hypothetical protein [Escherichia coli]MDY7467011.1 hypothetical protein [Escherichia coli]QHD14807.1 hypothetical protein CPH39_17430 [Escherichia coli]